MKLMNSVKSVMLGAIAATVMAGTALAADVTIRIGHLNPADPTESHSGAMTAVFKSLVETASNGEIEVKLFPNGQLGKDNEVIQQVRDGIVESCISSSGGVAQHYPLVGVFDIPFAFPNIYVSDKVMSLESDFGKKFAADMDAKTGLHTLAMLDSGGFFAFTNSKRPIKTVEDMKGLRLRTSDPADASGDGQFARCPVHAAAMGRGLHRAADRCCRWPDEPDPDHCLRQVR